MWFPILKWTAISVGSLAILLGIVIRLTTFHPSDVQSEKVHCPAEAPTLKKGQNLRVLSWNVQYMASKNYLFYYDLPNNSGPDMRPSSEHIAWTLGEVARVIREENPDVILLQEVDHGAARTDHEDQLEKLLALLPKDYSCHASAFYWQAKYVPHPKIKGSVGMKLSVVSKYQIKTATRFQLPLIPHDILTQQFYLKRAILETRLPTEGGGEIAILDTHLDAFAQGYDTMEQQVRKVDERLQSLEKEGTPWLIAGDFNLLPPGFDRKELVDRSEDSYRPNSELGLIYGKYPVFPGASLTSGPDRSQYFSYFSNFPEAKGPDRTIDYLFHSPRIQFTQGRVRNTPDTLKISDHLPMIVELKTP